MEWFLDVIGLHRILYTFMISFGYSFRTRFTVCFSLPMMKFNSNEDSVSEV